MRPEAEKRIKTGLVLEKVVEVENVEVSDEKRRARSTDRSILQTGRR